MYHENENQPPDDGWLEYFCRQTPVTVKRSLTPGQNRLAVWLMAGVLAMSALSWVQGREGAAESARGGRAESETNQITLPTPEPARRQDLAAGFLKPVPASIAELKVIQRHVETLIERVSPAVVAVEIGNATGTGVIVSPDGLVLSAGHVAGAPGRRVVFRFPDGKVARGRTLGHDEEIDAGVMRISDRTSLPHVPLGELQSAQIGDWVLALGHPGGFDAKRSLVVRLGRLVRFGTITLQSDCTIAPGDSGGPLIDMQGRLIGIHTTISGAMSENFHVSITRFLSRWDALVHNPDSPSEPTSSRIENQGQE